MAKALDYLRGFDKPDMTYSVALRTMVLCAAEPKKDLLTIRQNVAWLEQSQLTDATSAVRGRKGAWAYSQRQGGQGDNSNTQFAMLALNEAERVGVAVDPRTWRLAQEYWQQTQQQDGSWGYKPGTARDRQHDLRRHLLARDRQRPAEFRQRQDRRRQGVVLWRERREQWRWNAD